MVKLLISLLFLFSIGVSMIWLIFGIVLVINCDRKVFVFGFLILYFVKLVILVMLILDWIVWYFVLMVLKLLDWWKDIIFLVVVLFGVN